MNIKKLSLTLASAAFIFTSVSCGTNKATGITVDDFVNALVEKEKLTGKDGVYTYQQSFQDHAVDYTLTLNCIADSYYSYVFESTLVREISTDTISGLYTSQIKFNWGKFKSSLFQGKAHFEMKKDASHFDDAHYIFYGLAFDAGGTYGYGSEEYIDPIKQEWLDLNYSPLEDTWKMTKINIEKLNALTKSTVNCYLW